MLIEKAFKFRQMPSGRHAFALALVSKLAAAGGLAESAARADRAVAQAHTALELEQMWSSVRKNKSRARGDSQQVDRLVDEQISALEQKLQADAKGDDKDPVVKMARELLRELFPEGLRGVTQKALEVQQGTVDIMLKRLDGEFAGHVATLHVERQVERIRGLNEELRVEMAYERAKKVTYKDVVAAEKLLHSYVCKAAAAVYFELDGEDAATQEQIAKILGPFVEQQERVLLDRKRRRKTVDVNPKTGEELPEDDVIEDGSAVLSSGDEA